MHNSFASSLACFCLLHATVVALWHLVSDTILKNLDNHTFLNLLGIGPHQVLVWKVESIQEFNTTLCCTGSSQWSDLNYSYQSNIWWLHKTPPCDCTKFKLFAKQFCVHYYSKYLIQTILWKQISLSSIKLFCTYLSEWSLSSPIQIFVHFAQDQFPLSPGNSWKSYSIITVMFIMLHNKSPCKITNKNKFSHQTTFSPSFCLQSWAKAELLQCSPPVLISSGTRPMICLIMGIHFLNRANTR